MSARLLFIAATGVLLAIGGCSPALNWRQVPLGELRFTLPCKPDQAQRAVTLADRSVALDMQGCEADGALFAISRAQVGDATAVPAVLAAWRVSALAAMQASPEQTRALPAPAVPGVATASWLAASGQRPQGGTVQAQLGWLVQGSTVYHLAVYADRLRPELTEPFVSDIAKP
ncbi:hypothetical protein [uncultured Rhodoferax sp.]|uniref:hypothetical protein n=1 Tax=uncultured Rhodoferax sp. TaxID=223188 RepID=UPI0025D10FA4|nr:hypothetical protein [uncultured Rhodoferax sp.]